MIESKLEAAVGMSRKWDAREAGKEVARSAIEKLSVPPDFFLLFSTIHYEKNGGFEEFLNGVWDVLPEGTPLVGGTVAGFINNHGCYTRGTTALAVSYKNMDVAVGVGKKIKRNPKKAAKKCAEMIKDDLDKSDYNNNFLIDVISGGLTFQIPFVGRRTVFRDIPGFLTDYTVRLSSFLFNKGPGREEEALEELTTQLDDYYMLSGSCMDDNLFLKNYQFYNREILENSMICLGIKTDLNFDTKRDHGLSQTTKQFKVTKMSSDKRFVYKINNKPAVKELLKIMGWPDDYMTEKLLHSRTLYYPLGFNYNDEMVIDVIALVSGNSLCAVHQIKDENLHILSASGKELVKAVDNCLIHFSEHEPSFGLIFSCGIRLDTLGSQIFGIRDKLLDYFKEKPFLLTYVTGEGFFKPNENLKYGNDTFNISVFWDK